MAKKENKAWDKISPKDLSEVAKKAIAAKHGKTTGEDNSTLVRISAENHKLLRIMAAMEGRKMQDLIDNMVAEYKAKKHPGL